MRCLPWRLRTGVRIGHQAFVEYVLDVNGAVLGHVDVQIVEVGMLLGGEFDGFSAVVRI